MDAPPARRQCNKCEEQNFAARSFAGILGKILGGENLPRNQMTILHKLASST